MHTIKRFLASLFLFLGLVSVATPFLTTSTAHAQSTIACQNEQKPEIRVVGYGVNEYALTELKTDALSMYARAAQILDAHNCAPIDVEVMPSLEMAQQHSDPWHLPVWAAGAAEPEKRRIVVFQSSGRMVQNTKQTLAHELAHIVVSDAAQGHEVPRWLNEGIARWLANETGDVDSKALAQARIRNDALSLTTLTTHFPAHNETAQLAYAISGRIVSLLVAQHGPTVLADLLRDFAQQSTTSLETFTTNTGTSTDPSELVDEILQNRIGMRMWQLDGEVKRSVSLWYAWSVLLRDLDLGFALAAVFAVGVLWHVRRRQQHRLAQLAAEEDALLAAFPEVTLVRLSHGPHRRLYLLRDERGPLRLLPRTMLGGWRPVRLR